MDTQYQAYQRQFDSTLTHLVETSYRPYLVGSMIIDTDIQGMTKVFKRIGGLTAQRKQGRHEVVDLQENDFSARHLAVRTWYVPTAIDMEDVEKMVNNPQDDIYTECVHAIYDAQTNAAFDGFFADVVINEDASGTTSFPAANKVAVNYSGGKFAQNSGAADIGLNIDKLLRVKWLISQKKIRVNTSDMNALNIAVTEDDVQTLLAGKIGTDNFPGVDKMSGLYMSLEKATEQIQEGQFSWWGYRFHIVPDSYFDLDASGNRLLPVWIKDGMVYGLKTNVATEVVKLPNTVESVKIQALTRVGTMRKNEDKVYQIAAKPSS